jgi:hypothetical protein
VDVMEQDMNGKVITLLVAEVIDVDDPDRELRIERFVSSRERVGV